MKKRTQPAKDLYQQITDQILEALEQGVMPWQNLGIVDGHKWLFHATVKVVVNTLESTYFCFG